MNTRNKGLIRLVMVLLLLLTSSATVAFRTRTAEAKNRIDSQAFHDAMRKLWEDHVTWTRLVIVSVANDLPDTQSTVDRLLQNQADIGNAIKPF